MFIPAGVVCLSSAMCLCSWDYPLTPLWVFPSLPLAMILVVGEGAARTLPKYKRSAAYLRESYFSLAMVCSLLWLLVLTTKICSVDLLPLGLDMSPGFYIRFWIPAFGAVSWALLYLVIAASAGDAPSEKANRSHALAAVSQVPLLCITLTFLAKGAEAPITYSPLIFCAVAICWATTLVRALSKAQKSEKRLVGVGTVASIISAEQMWEFRDNLPDWLISEIAGLAAILLICVVGCLLAASYRKGLRPCVDSGLRGSKQIMQTLTSAAIMPLSGQEQTVLEAMLDGKTGKEIAAELGISESSVGTFRKRGYEKLGIKKKSELLDLAAESKTVVADAGELSTGKKRGKLPRLVLAVAVMLTFVMPSPPNNVSVPGALYWIDCRPMVGRAAAVLILLNVGYLLGKSPLNCFEDEGAESLALAGCGLWASMCLVCSWGYSEVVYRSLALALLFVATPARLDVARGDGLRIWIAEKVGCLLAPRLLLMIALGFVLEPYLDSLEFDYHSGSAILLPVGIGLILSQAIANRRRWSLSVSVDGRASERERKRMRNYLLGRGFGELQAECVVLILSGWSVKTVAQREYVAESTVRSYCWRTCAALNMKSMDELGTFLSNETKI